GQSVPYDRSQDEGDLPALGQGAGDWLIAASRSEDGCRGKGYSASRRDRGDAQALSSQAKREHILAVSLACHDFAGPVQHSEGAARRASSDRVSRAINAYIP